MGGLDYNYSMPVGSGTSTNAAFHSLASGGGSGSLLQSANHSQSMQAPTSGYRSMTNKAHFKSSSGDTHWV